MRLLARWPRKTGTRISPRTTRAALVALAVLAVLAVLAAANASGEDPASGRGSVEPSSEEVAELPQAGRDGSASGGPGGEHGQDAGESGAGQHTEPNERGQRDTAEPPRRVTIAGAGDILPHTPVIERAAQYGQETGAEYDFRPMFEEVAPVLRAADLAICHVETPLSADNADVFGGGDRRAPSTGFPLFTAPWQLAEGIADAGFDGCSTAHNHSMDAGQDGVVDTIDALEAAGVAPAGTARAEAEQGAPAFHQVADVDVAHLSYTYGTNVAIPEDKPWMVDLIDVDTILADAEAARAEGAELVVVSLHHGLEYQVEPSDNQRARTDELLESDAVDLLLGHHAHVVQPIGRFHDKVAVHGLGNLLSNMLPDRTGVRTQDGVIVAVDFVEDRDERGRFSVEEVAYVPTWVDRGTHVIVDVGTHLDGGDVAGDRRAQLEASWERTVEAITTDGAEQWGVEPMSGLDFVESRPQEVDVSAP